MREVDRLTFQSNIHNRSTKHKIYKDCNNISKEEVRIHFDSKGSITGIIVRPDRFFLPERLHNELY